METFAMNSIEDWLQELRLTHLRYKANEITQEQYDEYTIIIEERIRDWFTTLKRIVTQIGH